MADPSTYKPAPGQIPTSAGVYRFLDEQGRVIYVGKAKNLRQRLSNYFQDLSALHPRTQKMVTTAVAVKWTVVQTEVESLALEYSWIKEFNPRFNVMYKDDKSYPYLVVTMGDTIPRVQVMRGARKPKVRYFGPFVQAWSIRDTVDQLLRVFPVRTCSQGVLKRAQASGRPCLLGYIDKCSAPCVGRISVEDHYALAEDFCSFMSGRTGPYVRELEKQMQAAAQKLDYERAARLRDDIAALKKVIEANAVVLPDATNADVFALVRDELEAAVQVFHVRGGRIRGQRGWVVELVEPLDDAALLENLIEQVYGDATPGRGNTQAPTSVDDVAHSDTSAVPREILVPTLPQNLDALRDWLSSLRGASVEIRVPHRGDKRALLGTVLKNAEDAMRLHKAKRVGDLTQRSAALEELAQVLELETAPLRIECYDVSHTQGTHQVASMVVFEDGAPRKSEYRKFVIRGEDGNGASDDTAAMREVLTRRVRRYLAASGHPEMSGEDEDGVTITSGPIDPQTGKPKRFAYAPSLIVVDGGLPQVNAAQAVIEEMGADIPVIGLAKRLEEVWVPGHQFPVIFPRTSAALYLLQYLRDESHRAAITHHRKRRAQAMTRSVLDEVPGLGPAKQSALLRQFGSVAAMRELSVEQLTQAKGVGSALAQAIKDHLDAHPAGGAKKNSHK